MKKFREWVASKTSELGNTPHSRLVTQDMLPEEAFILENNRPMEIVLGTEQDLEAIMEIQKACYGGKAPWGRIAVNRELRNIHNAYFLVCYDQTLPIAFIGMSMRKHSMHITNIATRPPYQGQGIASYLIKTAIGLAQKLKRNAITLEVRISNDNAKRIYSYLGFQRGRVKPNYYHDNGEDALEMFYIIEEMDELNDKKTTVK